MQLKTIHEAHKKEIENVKEEEIGIDNIHQQFFEVLEDELEEADLLESLLILGSQRELDTLEGELPQKETVALIRKKSSTRLRKVRSGQYKKDLEKKQKGKMTTDE